MVLAYDRAAIHLTGRDQLNLFCVSRCQYVSVGSELRERRRIIEHDLNLLPERVETVALDGIEYTHKGETVRLGLVRHIDSVDRTVVGEGCPFAARGQFFEVNIEKHPIVKGRHDSGDAIHAAGPGWNCRSKEERDQSTGAEDFCFHNVVGLML